MSAHRSRIHWSPLRRVLSRTASALLILAAHGLVLWMFWQVHAPVATEIETFTSILFFVPAPSPGAPPPSLQSADRRIAAPAARAAGGPPAAGNAPQAPAVWLPPSDASTAITLPAPPGAGVDWSAQLTGAAQATLDNERKTSEQLGALLRKFRIEEDPRNPGRTRQGGFRWYDAGIHRVDTRGILPAWHLNDRCVLVAFIFAACALGHIEIHGDLFDGAAAAHAESLATPRPNDVP